MKFILEYVTCCMLTPPCNTTTTEPPSPRTDEEIRSLVTAPRRRRKTAASYGADWRPSLNAIEEDNAVSVAKTVVEKKKVENVRRPVAKPVRKIVNRCGSGSAQVNGPSRSYEFSHDPFPMVVPTFSAAPFMF